jgi:hypothetical protein
LHSVVLPDYPTEVDAKTPAPPFPLFFSMERFWSPGEAAIIPALMSLEAMARNTSLDGKHPACEGAKQILSLFNITSNLFGWQHVFSELTPQNQSLQHLEKGGEGLVLQMCKRIEWMLGLLKEAGKSFNADLCLRLVAADREWCSNVLTWAKEVEATVSDILRKNKNKFQEYRQRQRSGVSWPHSTAVRDRIEMCNFTYRPMMLKRDRCVCEVCGVEVYGWRPWHDPMSFHLYAKHPPAFQPVMLHAPSSIAVSQLVTEANQRTIPSTQQPISG